MSTIKCCVNCKKEFSIYYIENGVKKHSDKRKFCYECSPIGKHNTRPSFDGSIKRKNEVLVKPEKTCKVCGVTKKIEEFYKGHKSCKKCHCDTTLEKQRLLKMKCVEYLGGECVICGYKKYQGSLHFHHKNEHEKEFGLSHMKRHSFEFLKKELDKCILVCANCHGEIHANLIDIKN